MDDESDVSTYELEGGEEKPANGKSKSRARGNGTNGLSNGNNGRTNSVSQNEEQGQDVYYDALEDEENGYAY